MELERTHVTIDRPLFLLSLDTELGWGSFDHGGMERHRASYGRMRELIPRMLALLAQYRIRGTWAVVGHLFLERCAREGEGNHNHVLQPQYRWWPQGWLSHDPFGDARRDPFFYAPDLVDAILACPYEQELASHTFTHAILGDPDCTREVAHAQLAETVRLAQAKGRAMRSLVFPRNLAGHLDVVSELGFTSYRGMDRTWYQRTDRRTGVARALHVVDRWLAAPPRVFTRLEGLRIPAAPRWTFNLPGSMFLIPDDGVWGAIPASRRIAQARKGLEAAARARGIFHLWFHPFNLGSSPRMMGVFEAILEQAARLREREGLESWSMAQTADHLESRMGDARA